jgi:succinyl-CoA synthetase beta subunit
VVLLVVSLNGFIWAFGSWLGLMDLEGEVWILVAATGLVLALSLLVLW